METDKQLEDYQRRRTIELLIKFLVILVVLGAGISVVTYLTNRYVVNPFPQNLELTQSQQEILGLRQVVYENNILNRTPEPGIELSTERGMVVATSEACQDAGDKPESLLCSYYSAHYSTQASTWRDIFIGTLSTRNRETQTEEWPGAVDDQSLFVYFYKVSDKASHFERYFQSQCKEAGVTGDYHLYEDREFGMMARTSYLAAKATKPGVAVENAANFDILAEGVLDTHASTIGLKKVTCADL